MSFQDGMKRAWCGNCGERFGIIDAAPTTEERVASQVTEMAIELSNDVDAAREELKGWKRAFVRLSGELSVRGKVEASCIIAGLTEKQTVAVLTAFGALGSPDMVLGYEERPERDTWPR